VNGRNHVLVGACGWLLVAPEVTPHLGPPLTSRDLMAGTLLCAGSALLPDSDHPRATIAGTLGPLTKGLTRVIAKISGGHRNATHSLIGAVVFGLGALALMEWRWGVFAMFWLCGSWALRLLGPDHLQKADILAAGMAAWAAWWISDHVEAGPWMVAAVVGGCGFHLVGDLLTKGTIPLFWPLKVRIGLGLLRSGTEIEEVLSVVLTVAAVLLGWKVGVQAPATVDPYLR
jgi:membrane-bound metal-dependent hydrolase YbcI (DUF457 family)